MELINSLIKEHSVYISLYALAITFVSIINIINTKKKSKRYMILKKETIKFFNLFNKEWERSDDLFLQQLYDENQRLENEVKVLRKENTKLSILGLLQLLVAIFLINISMKIKKK